MALFGKKKNTDAQGSCDCGGACTPAPEQGKKGSCCCGDVNAQSMAKAESAKSEGASIKVLGSGCSKCNQLEDATKTALEQLGMDTTIDHITDFAQIASYGVMTTPALVVDGKVVSYGKVLKTEEVIKILQKIRS